MRKPILIFDNYDSFTYNVVHVVEKLGYKTEVFRNDKISLDDIDRYDQIILSPGPGIPSEAGILLQLIKRYAASKSIFGICLGEQAIGEAFGATLENLSTVFHGVASTVDLTEKQDPIFESVGESFEAGRYHSWVVSKQNFPSELQITAIERETGQIMALRHRNYNVFGVQFHPESILTPEGEKIIENFLKLTSKLTSKS